MLIFEHRSAVYMQVNEQRSTGNQRMMAALGDFEQALSGILPRENFGSSGIAGKLVYFYTPGTSLYLLTQLSMKSNG